MIDLEKAKTSELLEHSKLLEKELAKRKKSDMRQAYKEFEDIAKLFNSTIEEILEKGKPVKLEAKYRDDKGNTWSGYGKQPNWIKEGLVNGKTLDDYKI